MTESKKFYFMLEIAEPIGLLIMAIAFVVALFGLGVSTHFPLRQEEVLLATTIVEVAFKACLCGAGLSIVGKFWNEVHY